MALGDSITDGFGSTADANQRWTNLPAERLQSNPGTSRLAVLNAGISGNRMLHDLVGTSALARLDRDVLVQTGVQYVIVLEGNTGFPGFYTPALELKRQAVNHWIRNSKAYDAVIDFDKVLRDPSHPTRILPAYDSGDHAHPNDAGYRAMADAVDLFLFRDDDEA